jgi:ABC-type transport system substrate-binding protein
MKKSSSIRFSSSLSQRMLITFLAVMTCTGLIGCSQDMVPVEDTRTGGVLYFGIEAPFHGFDVLGTSGFINPTQAPLNNLIQEPLFRMDASGNLIPVLGLTATPSANGSIWDIQLRQNVFFHDDTPFTADAVIHHWSRILDPQNRYMGRPTFKPINSIKKIDDYTVRFILDHPWPPFLEVISDELFLFNFIPSPTAVEAGVHDRKPVGTGPFKYHKWNSGDHFVVLKNDRYWQKEKPLLNKVVFRAVPDHQTRYASLLSGELDIITLDRGNLIQKARNDPALSAFQTDSNGAEIILINTTKLPLDDLRVRRALAMANNQALHIKMVYGDTIPFIHHPFGESFACKDDGYLQYNPEQARQLIAEYGQPVAIECLHSNTSRGRDIGAVLQQLYKDIGVKFKPVALSTGPQVMKVLQKDFQMATWRIPPSRDHGPQLYRSFHSQSPTNFSGYANPEMDRLLELQRVETDAARRDDLLCRIVRQLNSDVPFLYRGGRRFHYVARKKIRDMMDTPGFMVDLASAWFDEQVKFNTAAYEIEQNASVDDFDCPEPGDTERVKAIILGSWQGQDDWGATIKASFKADDTVTGSRTGSSGGTQKYVICGSEVHWSTKKGAKIVVAVSEVINQLDGQWNFASYSGKFTLTPVQK